MVSTLSTAVREGVRPAGRLRPAARGQKRSFCALGQGESAVNREAHSRQLIRGAASREIRSHSATGQDALLVAGLHAALLQARNHHVTVVASSPMAPAPAEPFIPRIVPGMNALLQPTNVSGAVAVGGQRIDRPAARSTCPA